MINSPCHIHLNIHNLFSFKKFSCNTHLFTVVFTYLKGRSSRRKVVKWKHFEAHLFCQFCSVKLCKHKVLLSEFVLLVEIMLKMKNVIKMYHECQWKAMEPQLHPPRGKLQIDALKLVNVDFEVFECDIE